MSNLKEIKEIYEISSRISMIPPIFGMPLPSALFVMTATLLFGFAFGLLVFVLHYVARKWIYGEYQTVPLREAFGKGCIAQIGLGGYKRSSSTLSGMRGDNQQG